MSRTKRKHSGQAMRTTIKAQLRRACLSTDERRERKQQLRRTLGLLR